MSHVLKMTTLKLRPPIAVLIRIKRFDLSLHKLSYARIMMSSILSLVTALTA